MDNFNLVTKLKQYKIKDKDDRRFLFNVLGNYLVKGGAMIISLLVMPAYMRYFESQTVLGMWFTIVQVLNWIMLLDLGIGGELRIKIIKPLKENNKKRITELLSAAYISVGAIVIILIVLQHFFVNYINWYMFLGVSPDDISRETLIDMVHILIIGVCIRFFAVLVSHLFYALQQAILPGLINLISSALILLYLLFANPTGQESDIIVLSYVNVIANNIPAIVATFIIFFTVFKGMYPRLTALKLTVVKEILGKGGVLFYTQIVLMLLFNVKEIYISWFVAPSEVVDYQIYYKLIGVIGGLYMLALNPVWSAVTKAIVERKMVWLTNLYRKGIILIGVFSIVQLLLVIIMPFLVNIWLGNNAIEVSRSFALIFCIYNLIYMWVMLNYNFACGMGMIRLMSIGITVAGISNFLLTIFGSHFIHSWIVVIVATTIVAIPCAMFMQKNIFKTMRMITVEGKSNV